MRLVAAGHYCLLGSSTPTPTDNVTGNICPMGHYCPRGSAAARACSIGHYLDSVGNGAELSCKLCDPGERSAFGNGTTASKLKMYYALE